MFFNALAVLADYMQRWWGIELNIKWLFHCSCVLTPLLTAKAIGEYRDRLLSIFVLESVLDQTAREWETTNLRLGGMEKLRNCSPENVFWMVTYKFPLGRTPFANIFREVVSSLIHKEDNEPVQHLSKRLRECEL